MSQIMTLLPKILPIVGGGLSFFQNYQAQKKRDNIYNTLSDPNKFNALVSQYRTPLNGGLTKGVGEQTQAFLADRGLGESPAIASEVQAQAIAPYIQQNQNTAIDEALKTLTGAGSMIGQGSDMTGLLKLLMSGKSAPLPAPSGGGGGESVGAPGITWDPSIFGDTGGSVPVDSGGDGGLQGIFDSMQQPNFAGAR